MITRIHIPLENSTQKPLILYLGLDDFPLGLSETQKARLVAKGLVHAGARVVVVSRWWSVMHWDETDALPPQGFYDNIEYVNASGWLSRPPSWWVRKIARIKGYVREFRIVAGYARRRELTACIVTTGSFSKIAYYHFLGKIFNFPTVVHVVEYYTALLRDHSTRKQRANARLFDTKVYDKADGVLPISQYLVDRMMEIKPDMPWLKDPCLVDMDRFTGLTHAPRDRYLLFCGYVIYTEIVSFILQAFEQLPQDSDVKLILVMSGTGPERERFHQELMRFSRHGSIQIVTGLTDAELSALYVNAYALLIPMRPTIQDKARFPHKIGEYCASGRPIVTTDVGEVGARFQHGVNAYVATTYDVGAYARVIEEALNDSSKADEIGARGHAYAQQKFTYQAFGQRMLRFAQVLRDVKDGKVTENLKEFTGPESH